MKKLNLGCGKDYRDGWVNMDIGNIDIYGKKIKVDLIHDINKYPYPFKDNEFGEILMIGVIQHCKDIDKCVKELARISKKGAIIKVEVAYFTSYFAYRELYTQKFSLNCIQLFGIFKKYSMKLVSKKLRNHNKFLKWIDYILNLNQFSQSFYERFFSGIFPVNNIEWVFKSI